MEKRDRGFKVIAVIALLIAVVGLSIAYAGYTASLTINGNGATAATVDASTWKIIWTSLSGDADGDAELPDSDGLAIDTTTNTSISGAVGTLYNPGDTITYTWKAENKGTIDAEAVKIDLGNLTCAPADGSDATTAQAAAVCDALVATDGSKSTFTYKIDNNNVITKNLLTSRQDNIAVTNGDLAKVDTTTSTNGVHNLTLVLKFEPADGNFVIDGPVDVSLGNTTVYYQQAED